MSKYQAVAAFRDWVARLERSEAAVGGLSLTIALAYAEIERLEAESGPI